MSTVASSEATAGGPDRVALLHAHQHLAVRHAEGGVHESEPRTVHGQAALTLVLEGEGTLWCGRTLELRPSDVVFVPPGTPHYVVAATERRTITLAICPSCMTSPAGERLRRALEHTFHGAGGKLSLGEETAGRLRHTLELLEEELRAPRARAELAIEGALTIVTALLERAAQARVLGAAFHADRGPGSLAERALEFVSTHATKGASLAEVAAHVGRSPAHVAATVKAQTGRTVMEWVTDVRVATACRLLLITDETVDVVAERVGFASTSHFHRVFRRQHAMTPARWRTLHRARSAQSGPTGKEK